MVKCLKPKKYINTECLVQIVIDNNYFSSKFDFWESNKIIIFFILCLNVLKNNLKRMSSLLKYL